LVTNRAIPLLYSTIQFEYQNKKKSQIYNRTYWLMFQQLTAMVEVIYYSYFYASVLRVSLSEEPDLLSYQVLNCQKVILKLIWIAQKPDVMNAYHLVLWIPHTFFWNLKPNFGVVSGPCEKSEWSLWMTNASGPKCCYILMKSSHPPAIYDESISYN